LKPDFENLGFFEVFGFISKIKKSQTKSGFFWLFSGIFQNNTAQICSLRQCDPLITGSVM